MQKKKDGNAISYASVSTGWVSEVVLPGEVQFQRRKELRENGSKILMEYR